jgi:hypothetical protein
LKKVEQERSNYAEAFLFQGIHKLEGVGWRQQDEGHENDREEEK